MYGKLLKGFRAVPASADRHQPSSDFIRCEPEHGLVSDIPSLSVVDRMKQVQLQIQMPQYVKVDSSCNNLM